MPDGLVQGALAEPVSLAEAKAQVRVSHSAEDALISSYIKTARARVENREAAGQVFVRQSRRMILDQFPSGKIEIVRMPVRSIESITYVDPDGNTQTWASSKYETNLNARLPMIRPVTSESYPSTKNVLGAVTVNYVAGHMVPFTANTSTNVITAKGHGKSDGDIVRLRNSGGALPAGLAVDTNYYVVTADTDTLQLSATDGGGAIDITSAGSETHFIGEGEPGLITAMLLIIADLYENRGEVVVGTIVSKIKGAIEDLCAPFRHVRR